MTQREALLEALEVHEWDFEAVANSLAYSSPAQVLGLKATIERLRALVKSAEEASGDMSCPWCSTGKRYTKTPHAADCAAFTPDGEVR